MIRELYSVSDEMIEVYVTDKGGIFQSDRESCVYLYFSGKSYKFSIQSLNDLKKIIDQVDLGQMCTLIEHADIEIILLKDHCLVLSGIEIVYLKEILQGTFTMFRLNSLVTDCLNRLVIS